MQNFLHSTTEGEVVVGEGAEGKTVTELNEAGEPVPLQQVSAVSAEHGDNLHYTIQGVQGQDASIGIQQTDDSGLPPV